MIKMKIVQINSIIDNGSTGKICRGISSTLNQYGIENYILFSQGKVKFKQDIKCSNPFQKIDAINSRIYGNFGFNSLFPTLNMIKKLHELKPDIVHLHNLHAHNCNLEILLEYLSRNKIKTIWTFHDCWAFTAYCPHYTMANCNQWKKECSKCPLIRKYSWFIDRSSIIFHKKRKLFENLNLTIVAPSFWMKEQINQSFLKNVQTTVIYNGINLNVFQPKKSKFREKYNIPNNKFVILGVAFDWGVKKGLDVFVNLSKKLDSNSYQIVLVGTNDNLDKLLPSNIIKIHRTKNQEELAEIYSSADLFVNPTREEVLGLVNIEALACGIPVLMFDTCGSPECIDDQTGIVVGYNDELSLYNEILRIKEKKVFDPNECRSRACDFNEDRMYQEYYSLYCSLNKGS